MDVAVYEVLHAVDISLLHVDTGLAGALGVVVELAIIFSALNAGTRPGGLAYLAHDLKPLLVDVLDSLDVDVAVALLKVHLRHPYGTSVMNPYKMAVGQFLSCILIQVIVVVV